MAPTTTGTDSSSTLAEQRSPTPPVVTEKAEKGHYLGDVEHNEKRSDPEKQHLDKQISRPHGVHSALPAMAAEIVLTFSADEAGENVNAKLANVRSL